MTSPLYKTRGSAISWTQPPPPSHNPSIAIPLSSLSRAANSPSIIASRAASSHLSAKLQQPTRLPPQTPTAATHPPLPSRNTLASLLGDPCNAPLRPLSTLLRKAQPAALPSCVSQTTALQRIGANPAACLYPGCIALQAKVAAQPAASGRARQRLWPAPLSLHRPDSANPSPSSLFATNFLPLEPAAQADPCCEPLHCVAVSRLSANHNSSRPIPCAGCTATQPKTASPIQQQAANPSSPCIKRPLNSEPSLREISNPL